MIVTCCFWRGCRIQPQRSGYRAAAAVTLPTESLQLIAPVLKGFDQHALLQWLKARGLIPVVRKGSQYFSSESAQQLIDILRNEIVGVDLRTGQRVVQVSRVSGFFTVRTQKATFRAKQVVVASGGLSLPKIGATAIAFEVAEAFGHTVVPPRPALVGMTLQKEQFWMKALSGISLPVRIAVAERKIEGDLLFAHRGISGLAVLNASLYWENGMVEIDFLPKKRLDNAFFQSRKQISTALGLPTRFSKAFLDAIGLHDQPLHRLTEDERSSLMQLKAYRFAPAGNFGYAKAEVTRGGVCTDEIDLETMESRKVPGLFFLGEALDVTGELGGYNFQWAFSTAQRLKL